MNALSFSDIQKMVTLLGPNPELNGDRYLITNPLTHFVYQYVDNYRVVHNKVSLSDKMLDRLQDEAVALFRRLHK